VQFDSLGDYPLLTWDPSLAGRALSYEPTGLMDYNHFATEHDIHALGHFPVPFDSYNFQAYAFAMNPTTNQPVNIMRFSAPDSPSGFAMSSSETGTTKLFTYATESGPRTVEIKSRMLTIAVRYSTLTLALTTSMFVANWILTLGSLFITFSAVKKGKVTWPVFMLHSAMVLVIPSIRKLYLCPPPFGKFLGAVQRVAPVDDLTI